MGRRTDQRPFLYLTDVSQSYAVLIIIALGQWIIFSFYGSLRANIITSFQTGNEFYRPYVSYQPSVYRWVSMYGKEQLKLFQINAYWRDNSGGLNNFLLASSQSFSMLVAFKRKNYY